MTPLNSRTCPVRGIVWAGFMLLVLSLIVSIPASSGETAGNRDEPSPSSTTTLSPSDTVEITQTASLSPTFPPSSTPGPTLSPAATNPPSSSPAITAETQVEPSSTSQPTTSPSISLTPSPTNVPVVPTDAATFQPGSILISEVAWAGTLASAHDEWVELYNPGEESIDLGGWILTDNADIHVRLGMIVAPYSFVLLERTDDSTVASIPADQIYSGSLRNSGDPLFLLDPAGIIIDSANTAGGAWPAGDNSTKATMERRGGNDQPGNWATFLGHNGRGLDSAGNLIRGTARGVNSLHLPPPSSPTPIGSQPIPSPTLTPTITTTASLPSTPGSVLINEVAWAGTMASSSDEWLELHNTGEMAVSLEGWLLIDDGDLEIVLVGTIPPHGYYLLERSEDGTIANISADLIYNGSLSNAGEFLRLCAPTGSLIDSANIQGCGWPAGDHRDHATMERRGGDDQSGNWGTFTGFHGVGVDAAGNHIQGTPRQINSIFFPTPEPTWIPGKLVINEVLMRPHYDWEGIGGVDTGDEFVELLNLGPLPVNLRGWLLDDISGAGSKPYKLPSKTLAPGEFVSFFRSRTGIALNDGGDSARLLAPDGRLVDQLTYLGVRAYNLSYGRLPDGSGKLAYGLWPTPGKANLLFVEPLTENHSAIVLQCHQSSGFTLALARFIRHPMTMSRLSSSGYRLCWIRD